MNYGKVLMSNNKIIDDFGDEWSNFNQEKLNKKEQKNIFNDYFSIFPIENKS